MLKKSFCLLTALIILSVLTPIIVPTGGGVTDTGTTVLATTRTNHAPVANSQKVKTLEDEPKVITLRVKDGDALRYEIVSKPEHGTLTGTLPVVTYTPNRSYFGPDSFTFKVKDGKLYSNVATVSITVVANHAPVAHNKKLKIVGDKPRVISLRVRDRDRDHLRYEIVSQPEHGTLTGTPPIVTYSPNRGYSGHDSFTFKANDGKLDSNVATVSITIVGVYHAPVAQSQSVTTVEGTSKPITLLAADSDGNALIYLVVSPPAHGALSGAPPSLTYTPNAGYQGSDSFTFKANDGKLDSNVATVLITVVGTNHAPVAQGQSVTTNEGTGKTITLSATDSDGNALIYQVVSPPGHGALTGSPPGLTYMPNAGYWGPDSFTFKANDGRVDSNVATVSITITAVNHAPVAQGQSVSTNEDTAKPITLFATDSDGDNLTYQVVSPPAHGTLSGASPSLTYTPSAGYRGSDSFTFKTSDGKVDSNVATVSITVLAVNHAPAAQNLSLSTDEGMAKSITLVAGDSDGDTLTYQVVSPPAHGTLSGALPSGTYTPAAGYRGSDSFTFKANDGKVDSNTATVSITVLAVNHAPAAQNLSLSTDEGMAKSITLVAGDSDGDTLTYQIVSPPAHGALSGTLPSATYTPTAGYHGSDSFTFKANDGKLDSNVAIVSITVVAVNHTPVAQNQTVTTDEGAAKAITLSATDSDGNALTYQVVSPPAHGALSGTPPSLTYTPNARYSGADNFTFSAYDGQVYSNVAMISITVTPAANRLSIEFPREGDTIQRSDIRVEGKIINGAGGETGVVVNGMLAHIYGDSFVVNHVPLVEGSNTITATATDAQGNTAAASLTVNASPTNGYIRITPSSEVGIEPLETVLTIDSSLDLTSGSLDHTGPGEVELLSSSGKEYRVRMATEGIYHFTGKVTDPNGTLYEDTIGIIVISKGEVHTLLAGKWEGMRAKLATGDIEGSLAFFSESAKDEYRELFNVLQSYLPAIVQEMDDAQFIEYLGDTAIYDIRTIRDGAEYSFQLLFTKDSNGIWRINSF